MKKFALIGHNISYSKSEILHKAIMDIAGVEGSYKIISIDRNQLGAAVSRLSQSFDGFNITKPFKTDILPYLTNSEDIGGAVNTVLISGGAMSGYNTDGEGFVRSLEYHDMDLRGKDVLILGAGGASRVIAYELDKIANVNIYNRNEDNARQLIAATGLTNTRLADLSTFVPEVVINVTPLGLNGEMSLPSAVRLDRLTAVYDTIYNPAVTPLMEWASERRIQAVNGSAMLVFQGLASQRIWQGIELSKAQEYRLVDSIERQVVQG